MFLISLVRKRNLNIKFFKLMILIGYTRIILLVIALHNALVDYRTFFICYSLSQVLDMADGYAARALGQTTKFGGVLDMVTDR